MVANETLSCVEVGTVTHQNPEMSNEHFRIVVYEYVCYVGHISLQVRLTIMWEGTSIDGQRNVCDDCEGMLRRYPGSLDRIAHCLKFCNIFNLAILRTWHLCNCL
jgi:hypothetical protein